MDCCIVGTVTIFAVMMISLSVCQCLYSYLFCLLFCNFLCVPAKYSYQVTKSWYMRACSALLYMSLYHVKIIKIKHLFELNHNFYCFISFIKNCIKLQSTKKKLQPSRKNKKTKVKKPSNTRKTTTKY
jgi:glucan phosphoethanolaminetransferase (alkaline phosphatase superfamily)